MQVRLFGGPAELNGSEVLVKDNQVSIRLMVQNHYPVLDVNDKVIVAPVKHYVYVINTYQRAWAEPLRIRKVYVGIHDGSLVDDLEINAYVWDVMDQAPLEFPEFSILNEFDDWFAAEMYKVSGRFPSWTQAYYDEYVDPVTHELRRQPACVSGG